MCGIFGYVNYLTECNRRHIVDILLKGLRRQEYRGYDSAGIAFDSSSGGKIEICRQRGKVEELESYINARPQMNWDEVLKTHCGIAHTRWATHGEPSAVNSHPQRSDENNQFVAVHNGIITNYKDIKQYLMRKGYKFESETDTEIVLKLVLYLYEKSKPDSFLKLIEMAMSQLEGAFAFIFKSIHYPNEICCTRKGSPLIVGVKSSEQLSTTSIQVSSISETCDNHLSGENGENGDSSFVGGKNRRDSAQDYRIVGHGGGIEFYFASDVSAIVEHTPHVIFLEDYDVAWVRDGNLTIHKMDVEENRSSNVREIQEINVELKQIMKGSYDYFMEKEIFEQPESIVNTMRGRVNFEKKQVTLGGIQGHVKEILKGSEVIVGETIKLMIIQISPRMIVGRLILIACGTSYHSGLATRQLFEELTELPVLVELASDFLDRQTPIFRDDVCLFISQSGETADTLSALRYCKKRGALIVGVTNTVGSSICRESQCGIHINAGPEIGVASTKAYTSQFLSLVLLALVLSEDSIRKQSRRNDIFEALKTLPDLIRNVLDTNSTVKTYAKDLAEMKSLLIMGRGYNYATCLEGALKVKELSYMHSEGILAGELKHGPLAMVDDEMPIVMIVVDDPAKTKCMNAYNQVIARGGKPIIVCSQGDDELYGMVEKAIVIPKTVDCLQGILTVIPLQLLSFHIAVLRGLDVDCPRNLAKSVTVL